MILARYWLGVCVHIAWTFFAGLLRHSLFENALQHFIYDADEEEEELRFLLQYQLRFLFFFQTLDVIASRSFLSNETTVCQRQQQKHTHDGKKSTKSQSWNRLANSKKSQAGRFIAAQDHHPPREEKTPFTMTKQKCSFFHLLLLVLVLKCILASRFCLSRTLSPVRDYDSGNQIMELPELKWFSAFWWLFFAFIIIFRFHLIIQTFYQPSSSQHAQRKRERRRKRNLTMCLMIYIDNVLSSFSIHISIDKIVLMARRSNFIWKSVCKVNDSSLTLSTF